MALLVALSAGIMIAAVEFVERRAASEKWAYERELAISLAIEKNSVKMVDRSALYELSGSAIDLAEAKAALESLKISFADARRAKSSVEDGDKFAKSVEALEKKVLPYGAIMADVEKATGAVRERQNESETAGKELIASLRALTDASGSARPGKTAAAYEAKSLAETLMSKLYLAQAYRLSIAISADITAFATMEERFKELEAGPAPLSPPLVADSRDKSRAFRNALEKYVRSLGEYGLVADARKRSGEGVLFDAAALSEEAITKANTAATRSLDTLWLVSVFVLIAAAVAIVLGIFIAVIVLKKLDSPGDGDFDWLDRKAAETEGE